MNTKISSHPLEQVFTDNAPRILRNPVWEHIFAIRDAVKLLTSFPPNASFTEIAEIFSKKLRDTFTLWGRYFDIPESGPLVVAANHPYSMLDTIAIGKAIEHRRKWPIKVISDAPAWLMPEWDHLNIPLWRNKQEQIQMREQTQELLQSDGTLIMYPAGVTSSRNPLTQNTIETPWKNGVIRFAKKWSAPILPVHVSAETSEFYNWMKIFLPRHIVRQFNLKEATRKDVDVHTQIWSLICDTNSLSAETLKEKVYASANAHYE